jgi:hypothetical protein
VVRFRTRPHYNWVKSLSMGGWMDASPPYRKLKRVSSLRMLGFYLSVIVPSILIFIEIPFLSEGQAGEVCRLSNKENLIQMWGSIRLDSNFTLFQASNGYNEHRCVVRKQYKQKQGHIRITQLPTQFSLRVLIFFILWRFDRPPPLTGLHHHTHGIRHTR